MKKTVILMMFALVGCVGMVSAQKPEMITSDKAGWHKIGETTVDFTKDKDEVAVLFADKFAELKFKVTDAPIDLIDVEVVYESGDSQKAKIGYQIKSPGESKTIMLNGGERSIKRIIFTYKTLPNHKDEKAHVEIWGLKTNMDKKK